MVIPRWRITTKIWKYKARTISIAFGIFLLVLIAPATLVALLSGALWYIFGVDLSLHSDQTGLDKFSTGFVEGLVGPVRSLFGAPATEGSDYFSFYSILDSVILSLYIFTPIALIIPFVMLRTDFAQYRFIGRLAKQFPESEQVEAVGCMLLDKSLASQVRGSCAAVLCFGQSSAIEFLSKFLSTNFRHEELGVAREAVTSLENIGEVRCLGAIKMVPTYEKRIRRRVMNTAGIRRADDDADSKKRREIVINELDRFFQLVARVEKRLKSRISP
jgi:hypothetical protein